MKEKIIITTSNKQRNYGIDFLRLISMFMVVVLHILGQGGILENVQFLSIKGEIFWLLEICCYCAVNVFAIISGVVGLKAKHKFSNLIYLCIQLMFYAITITSIELIISISNGIEISTKNIILHLFPSLRSMWYFSAYFCLFFFMPLLNTSRKILKASAIFVLLVFCCFGQLSTKVAQLNNGYSVLWLAILYLFGAYMAKYEPFENISFAKGILGFLICVALTSLCRIIIGQIYIPRINLLVSYTSPTIVLCSIFLVCAFKTIEPKNKPKKVITCFSPMAFGVYLIHCHPIVFGIMKNAFVWVANMPIYYSPFISLGIALAIFIACLFIDWLRILLFDVCKIKKFSVCLEKLFTKIATSIFKIFHIRMIDE